MTAATAMRTRWPLRSLGEFFQIKHGFAFKGEFFSEAGSHIVLTPGNFHDAGGFKLKEGKEKYYTGEIPNGYVLKRGDLIVAMTEQAEGLLGSAAIVPVADRFLHNQRLGLVINLREDLDKRFLYYLFNSRTVRTQIRASATGLKIRHTAPERIARVSVPVPPLPTQRKIATILSAYDDLIGNSTRRIKILEEMAQRLYREWFVDRRFPGHEKVKMVDSPLGKIPEGWEVKAFSALAEFVNGYAFKPSDWGTVGTPIIKIRELKEGVTPDTPRYGGAPLAARYVIEDGDILFSWSADLDVYLWSSGRGWLNQHLFNVLPRSGFGRILFYYTLKERMPEFRAKSLGTTMRHIKRSALDQVATTLPAEGLRVQFETLVEPVLDEVRTLRQRVDNLRRTRDLLLAKLISGEVDVSELEIGVDREGAA